MKKITNEDFIKKVNSGVVVLEEYKDTRTKLKVKCICNNIFYQKPSSIIEGRLCSISCHNINEIIYDKVKFKFIKKENKENILQCKKCLNISHYKNIKSVFCKKCSNERLKLLPENKDFIYLSKVRVKCKVCNHEFKIKNQNISCSVCAHTKK